MKILVADDSQTNLTLIENTLHHLGHDVVAVNGGEQAVDGFLKEKPDLVILDVLMGEMDGFECAKRIRQIESDDWIPIIFLSGSIDDESVAKGIDAGGDDYLAKPFSQVTLAAKIKAMQRISDMRKKLYEATCKLSLLSSTDTLTGIYNRLQFNTSIAEKTAYAKRHNSLMALLSVDVDNFKIINDRYGHHVGDQLLKEIAKRLKSRVRKYDFVARVGGDEFAVIISDIKTVEDASIIAQGILTALAKEYTLASHTFKLGCSIGIACFPFSGTEPEVLIRHADIAMYHAKESGRNNYKHFTNELFEKESQQAQLRGNLKFAFDRNEFFILYEPVFELESRKLVGFEASFGWNHPQFGLILPERFYPLADEVGISLLLGGWVIRTVCEQAQKWHANGYSNLTVSFNVSNRHLLRGELPDLVQQILEETNAPVNMLELVIESKETMTMNYNQTLEDNIRRLSEMGINIAVDDFGAGFSPLYNLKNWPVNCLKINKSFVADIESNPNVAPIIRSITQLANDMELKVAAKDIETEDELQQLLKNGCHLGQGSYLGKPISTEQIAVLLAELKK